MLVIHFIKLEIASKNKKQKKKHKNIKNTRCKMLKVYTRATKHFHFIRAANQAYGNYIVFKTK